ncbi:MAG: hypothetical protein GY798_30515, partial [Hyphomicrobiales bacterium]|nr:hypothetical protein [Hyphomicrobiales bacterium]
MKTYWQYLKQLTLYLYQQSLVQLTRFYNLLQSPNPLISQSLQMPKQYRIDIGHPDRVVILLVGCGGSGSFTAHILAQLACWAKGAGIDMR